MRPLLLKQRAAAAAVCLPLVLGPAHALGQDAPRLQLAEPDFQVGGFTEDADYALSQLGGVRVLPDGSVVVGDRGAGLLKLFSPDGTFVRDVGRRGGGPGEYQYILEMDWCAPDDLSVFDADARVHRYDVDMELISTELYSLDAIGGGRGYERDCNPQGYVVATGWGDRRAQSKPGYFVATAPVVLFRGTEVVHDFGERLSSERIGTTASDGTLTGSGPHPFGRETVVALGRDRVYLGSEESYEIEVYDLTGAPLEPIRWSGPALDYDHDLIDRLTEAAIDRAPERSRPGVRTWYRDLPELDQIPAYDRIVVSDEGQVWVRQFVRPGSSGVTWVVFNHAQELIGQLTLPPRSTLWEVHGDRVVYSTPDDYDVPVVRISRVERSDGP